VRVHGSRSLAWSWTLRYGLVTLLAISGLGWFVYERIEAALMRGGQLVLQLEVSELIEEMRLHRGEDLEDLARMIAPDVATASPDLKVTFQVFDVQGRLRFARGIEEAERIPLAPEVRSGDRAQRFRQIDLGEEYPFWVLASRGDAGTFIQISINSATFRRSAEQIRTVFLTAIPAALVVAALLGFAISRSSLRPASQIVATAREITARNLSRRIPRTGAGDEFDAISASFNEVLDRLESSVRVLRRFSGDAAHQLRTPLTALRGKLELALEEPLGEPSRKVLEELLEQVRRLAELVDSMLALARSEEGLDPSDHQPVRLAAVLEIVAEFLEPLARDKGLAFEWAAEADPIVLGDAHWLEQLLLNLVDNAIRYTAPGGHVRLVLKACGDEAIVRVSDTGRGIPEDEVDKIFDRFHRSQPDPRSHGAGLGLALAQQIAKAHRGRIDVESELGRGSAFLLVLPRLAGS